MDENDWDPGPDVDLTSMPTVSKVRYLVYVYTPLFDPSTYQNPLYFIVDYIAGVGNRDFSHAFVFVMW